MNCIWFGGYVLQVSLPFSVIFTCRIRNILIKLQWPEWHFSINTVLEAQYTCPVPHTEYKAVLLARMSQVWSRNVSTFLTGNILSKTHTHRTLTAVTCKSGEMFLMLKILNTELCRANLFHHIHRKQICPGSEIYTKQL